MRTTLISAHVIQSHLLFSTSRLGLEEHGLLVVALGTGVVLGTRQSRVGDNVRDDVGQFAGSGGELEFILNIREIE